MSLLCSRDVGRSTPTQISQESKTFESHIKQSFLSNVVWDASELVLCMQLAFKEEKWNEKTEKEEEVIFSFFFSLQYSVKVMKCN